MEISGNIKATRIKIRGRVQGIGFRPFVYRLAHEMSLNGWILNDREGVLIHVEGDCTQISEFIERLKTGRPALASYESLDLDTALPEGIERFEIRESAEGGEATAIHVQPDIATCQDCLKELFDPTDRRYRYPFINCTNCGPRYTIIRDVPYDRARTTMSEFPMCESCESEYHNPEDRRYHAQPNACPACGPHVTLLDGEGKIVNAPDPIEETVNLLRDGKIVAVKGLGGYHLACDATNDEAVKRLRSRKYREDKPFAVMMPDVKTVKVFCEVHEDEETSLKSFRRPIVLIKKRRVQGKERIAEGVAPHNPRLGVMLPYTPLHHLLFHASKLKVLVMTSGNISQEPIAYDDDDALSRLAPIADFFLIHNRRIERRVDDSVVCSINGAEYPLRRSRGYAPVPINLHRPVREILAVGAELKNTFCIGKDRFAYLSHHLGDLENVETLEAFERGIEDFQRLFHLKPRFVAYDLHPDYLSTKYALRRTDLRAIGIQHHHAHAGALLAEHALDQPILCFTFDGTGYGDDGTIWGGEVLIADLHAYKRYATLKPVSMPGGNRAIKEPWRMGGAYLDAAFGDALRHLNIPFLTTLEKRRWGIVRKASQQGLMSPQTTSMGRLFDGVSAVLQIREEVHYEGQAAVELEYAAYMSDDDQTYGFHLIEGTPLLIDYTAMFSDIINDLTMGISKSVIARRFHNTVAGLILKISEKAREDTGLNIIGLSGGCFQNFLLLQQCIEHLGRAGFRVLIHRAVPTNDGGISLGQLVIADNIIRQ